MDKNIRLTLTEPVIDLLAEKGYDPKMGARPLSRKIDELIRVPLSKKILFDHVEHGSIVTADYNDGAVKFGIIPPAPVDLLENKIVDENGIIQV